MPRSRHTWNSLKGHSDWERLLSWQERKCHSGPDEGGSVPRQSHFAAEWGILAGNSFSSPAPLKAAKGAAKTQQPLQGWLTRNGWSQKLPHIVQRQVLEGTSKQECSNQGWQTGHGASVCRPVGTGRVNREGGGALCSQETGSPTGYHPDSKPSHRHHQAARACQSACQKDCGNPGRVPAQR